MSRIHSNANCVSSRSFQPERTSAAGGAVRRSNEMAGRQAQTACMQVAASSEVLPGRQDLQTRVVQIIAILIAAFISQPIVSAQDVGMPDVVVPYAPDQPALRADQVFLRHEDFLKLYQQANPDALKRPAVNPLGSSVVATFLKSGALTPVDGEKQTLGFDGRFVVWSDSERSSSVPLPIGPVAIRSLLVDGKEGTVQPLPVGAAEQAIQDFANQQIQANQQSNNVRQAPAPNIGGPAYSVQVVGKGYHVVDVKFEISALVEGELGRADLPLRTPASGTLEWTLPADGLEAKIQGRTNVYRREGRTVLVPIAQLSTIRLQWLPTVQKVGGDVVYHSTAVSALAVQDSGMVLRTTFDVAVRQGEISELEVTIPEGYSVQSVSGEDIAGWTAQSTDATRSVQLQLRRTVNDATKVTLQLYANAPTTESLASLPVPISVVRGASRDLGTVILKTGSQFQVRSDSLSAVTQINPGEAPTPEGDELPGRPMLAWRYARHPASVTVKVTPTADGLSTDSLHAVRLEEQRQLWSSRMTLLISGAPRSRIDIVVPKDFLVLDVSATALKDWYFSDAVDGDQANADFRTLSIQLTDARSGQLQVAIQGQMNRDADRSLLRVLPPAVMNANKASSELAVWLDAASESAGIESGVGNGADWTVKSTSAAQGSYREISPGVPSLAFTSNAVRPGLLAVKLRQAVSTLIGESVTVTNVTETATEITLALNWTINRAAADHFAIELPTAVASVMTLEVPGQRRVTKDDLGNGKTRITLQLQQPVTDRLFVLGTASLPLPADKIIRSEVTNMVVPQGAPSTLSGQAHYWVLVNQSNGLLQPSAEQPEDKISPEQITTQIPPQLLQQAVAVVKVRPETAVWNLVYPEQFQVAPAVINLATHTTVISDDGSWRSRHQLQVTNESRQFLPVILPEGSRLMYCLVQGRPSRVVIRGEGAEQRHLIPIPQSGALASGFDVEFALAGRFEDSAASIRKEWKSHQLLIPVPLFPEFRDDPEFGISVSRNRWSVYVPESWRATLVEDPAATNVVKAASDELEDASLLSDVEQAAALLKSAKNAKGLYLRGKVLEKVQSATDRLNRSSGNERDVEQQRGLLLSKLNELSHEYGMQEEMGEQLSQQAPAGPGDMGQVGAGQVGAGQTDNKFLYEAEAAQNFGNSANVDQFWSFNGAGGSSFGMGLGNAPNSAGEAAGLFGQAPAQNENKFRFSVTLEDRTEQQDEKLDKAIKGKVAVPDGRKKQMKSEEKSVVAESAADFKDAPAEMEAIKGRRAGESRSGARSQLLERRGREENSVPETPMLRGTIAQPELEEMLAQQLGDPSQISVDAVQDLAIQLPAAPPTVRAATPTGLLSLQFAIPTDGQRIDFLRVGGNPELSLHVHSSDARRKGAGLVWLLLCGMSGMLLIGPGLRAQTAVFCWRLFGLLAVAGLALWLFTGNPLQTAGLLLCLVSVAGVAVMTLMNSFRRTA